MICCLVTLPGSEATGATGRDRGLWVVSWHSCALLSSLLVLTFHSDPVDFLAHLAADKSCFMGHGYFFFFKSILGKCPVYLCTLLCPSYTSYASRNGCFLMSSDRSGKSAFSYNTPGTWSASISKIKSRCAVKETCRCFF